MKKITIITVLLLTAGGVHFLSAQGKTVNPVIKSFGPVFEVPFTAGKPDADIDYKIVVDCGEATGKPIEKPGEMYAPLQHVARTYNLHIYGGVKQQNLHMAVAIWGDPINIVMNNEAYKKKYGVDNPNLKIISELKQAGVEIFGCGQSIAKYGVAPGDVNTDITPVLSRITVVSTLQAKGYSYFKY